MYDQVGGGFARYSVDARWLVPHFEKMLYDNALLARAYLHGWQVSGDPLLRRVCEETLDWMLAELRGPEGGFMSALDADSEGEEGLFYVWTPDQLRDVLGPEDAEVAAAYFGVHPGGNFEGRTILTRGGDEPPNLADLRRRLYEARAAARLAGVGRQAPDRLERVGHRRAGRGRSGARAAALPGCRPRRGGVRAARPARRRRPPAAHLQGRPGQAERLPGGPRLPPGRAARRCTRPRSSRAGSPRPGRWPTP